MEVITGIEQYWCYRIREAIVQASIWHEGQTRKEANIPYIAHLMGVALWLSLSGADEDTIIAGILHDILEDTPMKPEVSEWHFGANVLRMVQAVTEPDKNLPWEERKAMIIKNLGSADLKVKMISCADKYDNLLSIFKALKSEGFRENEDCSKAEIWLKFKKGYEQQKWFNQEILKALFANVSCDDLPPLFGKYMRLVESIFREQVILDEAVREKVKKK